jgi:hypothetical protein
VPPFRDSYQTSLFYTTLNALEGNPYLKCDGTNQALVFEIGRNTAVRLSPLEGDSIHPSSPRTARLHRIYLRTGIISLLLIILLWFTNTAANKVLKSIRVKRLIMAYLALLLLGALFDHFIINQPAEEPFTFFEGISIWPSELLRLLAVITAVAFFIRAHYRLKFNFAQIITEFSFINRTGMANQPGDDSMGMGQEIRMMVLHIVKAFRESPPWGKIPAALRAYWEVARYDWEPETSTEMEHLWQEYERRDSTVYRFMRLLPIVISYFLLCAVIISIEPPVSPLRGLLSFRVNNLILGASVLSSTFLIFYVFDVTRLCRRFITIASKNLPGWSSESLQKFAMDKEDDKELSMREWLLMHLIAKRTDAVGKLIFYPFIVWFILFLSRANYFDNWQTPLGLAVVISLGAVYAWSCAYLLRDTAEHARADAVHRLKEESMRVLATEPVNQEKMKRIEFVLKEISSLKEGAFAPFTQQPLLQALLVPFGGVGGVFMVDFFSKMNV